MENNNLNDDKKSNLRRKIILVFTIFLLALGAYAYYWFAGVYERNEKSKQVIYRAEKYESSLQVMRQEYDRCQEFISQREGDFGSFEYCKKFIEWVNANGLLSK
jgi:cell division protein FtsB